MSTYLINHLRIPSGVPNEEGLRYLEQVEATVKPYRGRGRGSCRGGRLAGVGGAHGIPSPAAAREWYHSADYQRIAHLRIDNAISDLILIDGVGPDFTVAGLARQIRAALGEKKP